jgi:hypothetical protein
MKTTFYLIATCFISFFAFMGALNMKNPFPAFGIAFGIWAVFIWGYNRRSKKDSERRSREQLFEDYMRSKIRNDRRHR